MKRSNLFRAPRPKPSKGAWQPSMPQKEGLFWGRSKDGKTAIGPIAVSALADGEGFFSPAFLNRAPDQTILPGTSFGGWWWSEPLDECPSFEEEIVLTESQWCALQGPLTIAVERQRPGTVLLAQANFPTSALYITPTSEKVGGYRLGFVMRRPNGDLDEFSIVTLESVETIAQRLLKVPSK